MKKGVVLGLLGVLAASIAYCTTQKLTDGFTGTERFHNWEAFMTWNCSYPTPVVFVNHSVLKDDAEIAAAIAHEMSHVQLATSFESCSAWHEWVAAPGHKLISEARAFCASVIARQDFGQDSAYWFDQYAKRLRQYPPWDDSMTQAQAEAVLGVFCSGR